MEYSQCSPSQQLQQPHQKQQQQARLSRDDSGSVAEMDDGWFSKCRCEGGSCLLAHCSASITSPCMHNSHHQWRMSSADIFDIFLSKRCRPATLTCLLLVLRSLQGLRLHDSP